MTDIESALRHYSAEVSSASYSYHMWKSINVLASADSSIAEAMNRNDLSWRVILHALQTTAFIALGRLFDADPRSLSARKLLCIASDQSEAFSRERLRVRKLALGVDDLAELERYLAASYEPTPGDFDVLLPQVDERALVFRQKYQPVRHKLLAHRDLAHLDSASVLYEETSVGEIEALLLFVHAVERYVWELLNNGRKYDLEHFTSADHERVGADVARLLDSLVRTEV